MNDVFNLSDPDGKSHSLSGDEAVSLYTRKEHLEGWEERVEPHLVLRKSSLVEASGAANRRLLSGWPGLVVAAVLTAGLFLWVITGDLNIRGYFAGLFDDEKKAASTNPSRAPVPLPLRLAPTGLKDKVEEINGLIKGALQGI